MEPEQDVAIDPECLSYLIDAQEGAGPPTDEPKEMRVALARLHIFRSGLLWVTPAVAARCARLRSQTVAASCARTRDADPALALRRWAGVLFQSGTVSDPEAIEERTRALALLHEGLDDCRVLAEAEDLGINVLLSHDALFVSRMGGQSDVVLYTPEDYWRSLGIRPGARALKAPARTSPIAQQTWWRW